MFVERIEKSSPATSPGLDPVGQAMISVSGFSWGNVGAVSCAWKLTLPRPPPPWPLVEPTGAETRHCSLLRVVYAG